MRIAFRPRDALAAVLLVAASAMLQAQEPAKEELFVYLIRDERAIVDSPQRDELALHRIVAPALELAKESGQRFRAKAKCRSSKICTAEALADAFFDYYPADFPSTSKAIADWIRRNNKEAFVVDVVKAGTPIALPCVPVSAKQSRPRVDAVRLYEPCAQNYSVATMTDLLGDPLPGKGTVTNSDDPRRLVNMSITRMTLEQYRATYGGRAAPLSHGTVVTARGDLNEADNRLLSVEFFSPPIIDTPTDCALSPYRDTWLERLQTLNLSTLAQDAANTPPLVIVDWDFVTVGDLEKGHGRKVFAAAVRALECLGLKGLEPKTIELHPRLNEAGLEKIVSDACDAHPKCNPQIVTSFADICNRKDQNPQPHVETEEGHYLDALCWIRTHDPPGGLRQKIDQYVLRSIFEAQLAAGAWMNVSFGSLRDEAFGIHQAIETLGDSTSMIFAAAGNGGPLRDSLFPQSVARNKRDRLVNVSFGNRDGTILGSFSNDDLSGLTEVAVLARGSEFVPSSLMNTAGSSFATPWVAAAAWAKRLIDKTQNATIRSELIRASRAVKPDIGRKIVSGGYFDPYLLLVSDPGRIVAADLSSSAIVATGGITYTVRNSAGDGTTTRIIRFCGQDDVDYFIFKETDGTTILWRRPRDGTPERLTLLTMTGTVQRVGHAPEPVDDFLQKFSEFTTRKDCSP